MKNIGIFEFIFVLILGAFLTSCQPIAVPAAPQQEADNFIWVGDDSLSSGPLDVQTQLLLEVGGYPNQIKMKMILDPRNLLTFQPTEKLDLTLSSDQQRQFVILQMFGITKPENDQDYFNSADAWIADVKSKNGTALLLYPWFSQVDSSLERTRTDAIVHQLAWKSRVVLVPVGPAWEKIRQEQPQIQLYASDGMHPSAEGVYLSACVIYASLSGNSPVGLAIFTSVGDDHPQEIVTLDRKMVLLLQQTAWDVIQDYQQKSEFLVVLPK